MAHGGLSPEPRVNRVRPRRQHSGLGGAAMDRDPCLLSLTELSALLRDGALSAVDATRALLDRIRRLDPRLGAYLTVLEDRALAQAAKAHEEIRAGRRRGPLHGVPVA